MVSCLIVLVLFAAGDAPGPTALSLVEDSRTVSSTPVQIRSSPLLLIGNRLFTYVSVNGGKKKLFLVDNGFRYTSFDPDLADSEEFTQVIEGSVNVLDRRLIPTRIGRIGQMRVGDLEVESPIVQLSPLMRTISRQIHRRIFGVVGMSLMSRYLTTIDLDSRLIVFGPTTPQYRANLLEQEGTVALPFRPHPWDNPNIHFVTVQIVINGVAVDAMVDFGYSGAVLTTLDPDKFQVDKRSGSGKFPVAVAGLRGEGMNVRVKSVRVGTMEAKDVPLTFMNAQGAPEFTMIGVKLLQRATFTFDYEKRVLYVHAR